VDVQAQRLHFNGMVMDVDLSHPVASMAYSDSTGLIWVNSGDLLKSFDTRDLSRTQTIVAGNKRSAKSAMTFWRDSLVVASGASILSWSQDLLQGGREVEDGFDVCLTLLMPSITCLTTCGDNLVVASSEHHTAHVYAPNGACAYRTIGHSAGITSLCGLNGDIFLSGSADQTAKMWDLRLPVPWVNLIKHKGIVTSVWGDIDRNHVFTGGTDGVVVQWDVRQFGLVFAMDTGPSAIQSLHYSDPAKKLTVIVSEKTSDDYYDLEKYGARMNSSAMRDYRMEEYSPNAVLTYGL
jgi:WD40 repeat protein